MRLTFSTRGWHSLSWQELIDTTLENKYEGLELYNVHKLDALVGKGGPLNEYNIISNTEIKANTGTYSLSAYSPEELYVRKHIMEKAPDIILNVIDSSNIERNLYLTMQTIDMDIRMVMALNMFDELKQSGDKLDYQTLGSLLGVPIVPTVGRTGEGINQLFQKIIDVYEGVDTTSHHIHVNHGIELENQIKVLRDKIYQSGFAGKMSTRFLAIKLMENDSQIL